MTRENDDSPASVTEDHPEGVPRRGASRRPLYVAVIGLMAFVALAALGYRWALSDALATLVSIEGSAERDRAQSLEAWFAASVGDDFAAGDGARTPASAVAKFRLLGGATLRLEPSSQIRFHHKGERGGVGLDVELGQVDVQSGEGSVRIGSEFGEIVMEENSSITMRRADGRLAVQVDLGSIQLGADQRAVAAGQSVELELGGILLDEPEPEEPAEPEPEPEEESAPQLDVGDGVPDHDLVVGAGASFAVHDPSPPTSIGFNLASVCEGPARVTAGRQVTEALRQANLRLARGTHRYEVRCLDQPDQVVAQGKIRILRDSGTKKLPRFAPTASVNTDGRRYTVMYQRRLPKVTVRWTTAPPADGYTLTIDGRDIPTPTPSHVFSSLARGSHRVAFAAHTVPRRKSRTTTVEVVVDRQAPTARVSSPPPGFAPGDSVTVAGQALPGWEVSVAGKKLETDGLRKFSTEVGTSGALPITFTHPKQGTHYYLRRPATTAP